jgi:hypothetical protein
MIFGEEYRCKKSLVLNFSYNCWDSCNKELFTGYLKMAKKV